LVPGLPLPGPLPELLCGIVLGSTVLHVVKVDPLLSAVAVLGMAILLFLAGFEVDVRALVTRDDAPARAGLVLSLVLAMVAAGVLWAPAGSLGPRRWSPAR
jgi:Kef-type K+ transport system membrane component KefB